MSVKVPLLTLALFALNLLLGGLVAAQLWRGSQHHELADAERERILLAIASRDAPAPPSFDSLQTQAVFHRSRSFYVPMQSPAAQQPVPDYRLAGSMIVPNRPASAVLISNATGLRVKVVVGDQLEGWSIADVNPRRVVVRLGDRTAEIAAARKQAGGLVVTPANQDAASATSAGIVRVRGSGAQSDPEATRSQ